MLINSIPRCLKQIGDGSFRVSGPTLSSKLSQLLPSINVFKRYLKTYFIRWLSVADVFFCLHFLFYCLYIWCVFCQMELRYMYIKPIFYYFFLSVYLFAPVRTTPDIRILLFYTILLIYRCRSFKAVFKTRKLQFSVSTVHSSKRFHCTSWSLITRPTNVHSNHR